MKKRTRKDFFALYTPEDEDKLEAVSVQTKRFWIPSGQLTLTVWPWQTLKPDK